MLLSVTRGPRQRAIVLVHQVAEARGDLVGAGHEDPILPLSFQLSPQGELQPSQSLDDLSLEPVQLGHVQIHILTVQLPQSRDHFAELLLIQILLFEELLKLDGVLNALASLTAELPDVSS